MTPGTTRLRSGWATSPGHRRPLNEDAVATGDRYALVADGMGGHAAGEVASLIAVTDIAAAVGEPVTPVQLVDAVVAANRTIRRRAADDDTTGMGTTLVGAVLVRVGGQDRMAVVHVGDSRCYRLRDGVLDLVTSDHSLVQELVDAGRLTPAAAAAHPMSNVVTRALGADDLIEPTVTLLDPGPCRLLLCSDGLSDELPARTIGRVLAGVDDPQLAADRLMAVALGGPARDNVTAVVIDLVGADAPTP